MSLFIEKHVFRLYVSVDYLVFVQKLKTQQDLCRIILHEFLFKAAVALQEFIETPVFHVLLHEVQVLFILKSVEDVH